jgi:hypothetical protein
MKNINTRLRIVIVTVFVAVFYYITQTIDVSTLLGINFGLNFDVARHILMGIIVYVGTYWALFFKIKGERFLTILLFPALGVMAGSFFTELMINSIFPSGIGLLTFQIFSTLIVGLFAYITILTVNILNAYYLSNIPLGQAARAAYFVLSLLITFIVYFILLSNDIFIVYKAITFFVTTLLVVYMCLWSIEFEFKERLAISIAIALLLTWGEVILSAWPINSTYASLILDLVFYFTLNMAMEMREKLTSWIWVEYAALFVVILVILLLLGEWGINGALI